jgi:hypothetical protein
MAGWALTQVADVSFFWSLDVAYIYDLFDYVDGCWLIIAWTRPPCSSTYGCISSLFWGSDVVLDVQCSFLILKVVSRLRAS